MLRFLKYAGLQLRVLFFFLPLLSFCIAAWFFGYPELEEVFTELRWYVFLLFSAVSWYLIVERYGITNLDELFALRAGLKNVFGASLAFTVSITLLLFFFQPALPSQRKLVLLTGGLLFVFVVIARLTMRAMLRVGRPPLRVLIVGADQYADRAAHGLSAGSVVPCRIVGFVRLPGQQISVTDARVFEFNELRELALGNGLDDVVIAAPPDRFHQLPEILARLEHLCVPIRAVLDFGENIFARDRIFNFSGFHILDLHRNPSESFGYLVTKRAFDIVFSLFVLVATLPLLLVIAAAIKLTSKGPIFFVQNRVGLNGKLFKMYKFRTMEVSDPRESDTQWTTANDSRRTRLGTFLRRTSLDELPQFFNALKGDMSVVGPRPERPHFVQQFLDEIHLYNVRHSLKVGITGWAQVNGWRGDTEIAKRLEFDLYYLRNWSLGFDLQIIALTVFRGLMHRNAY